MMPDIFSNDMMSILGGGSFGMLQGVISSIISSIIIWILGIIVVFVLFYVFVSYTLVCLGRKAGLNDDWMAFVPVASDLYRLRIVDAPLWYLFFFGFAGGLTIGLIDLLFWLIAIRSMSQAWITIGTILHIAHLGVGLYVTYNFNRAYYKGFNLNPMLALWTFVPLVQWMIFPLDVYLAYSNNVTFGNHRPAQLPGPSPVSGPRPSGGMGTITALAGPYKDARFTIQDLEEISFGRDSDECQIVFDQFNSDISRKHCTVRYNGSMGKYIVTDYSRNGTFTSDDKRLQPNIPVTLPQGTVIYLGNKKNVFRLG